jgi:lipoprotein-anchoring transpeptidase ErfK/SrfK
VRAQRNFRLFNYAKSFESYLDAGSVMFYAKRFFAVFLVVFGLGAASVGASVLVTVDRDDQLMRVYVEGDLIYVWPVSTGRMGYRTPAGRYSPTILRRMHYSRKYDYAPMPYAIFFRGGYAIHGTYSVGRLGMQASHGCIRLHPANARELFQMVQDYGPGDTRIVIR